MKVWLIMFISIFMTYGAYKLERYINLGGMCFVNLIYCFCSFFFKIISSVILDYYHLFTSCHCSWSCFIAQPWNNRTLDLNGIWTYRICIVLHQNVRFFSLSGFDFKLWCCDTVLVIAFDWMVQVFMANYVRWPIHYLRDI